MKEEEENKKGEKMNETKLSKIGKDWKVKGHHRIYFDAKKFAEIEVNCYNANFYNNKNFAVWYDCNTEKFDFRADGVEKDALKAIENIKNAAKK